MTNSPAAAFHLYTTILRVCSLEQSVDWYDRIMDMKVVYRDLGYKLASVQDSYGNRVTLWETAAEEPDPVPITPSSATVAFITEHAGASWQLLKQRGANTSDLIDDRTGVLFFWVYDPTGHALLVIQLLPE